MKGNTTQGFEYKVRTPGMASVEAVPSAKNFSGSTSQGFKNTVKSSATAGFSASRKKGSIKGC